MAMAAILTRIVAWLIWFGCTAAIIKLDAAYQRRAAERRGEVDFLDRSVTTYLALALCCAPGPLIAYFTVTRGGVMGFLTGVAAAIVASLVAYGALALFAAIFTLVFA